MVENEPWHANSNPIFFLTGARGVGKTALLAAFFAQSSEPKRYSAVLSLSIRFDCGYFRGCTAATFEVALPATITKKRIRMRKHRKKCWLKLASSSRKAVVILDGFDKVCYSVSTRRFEDFD